MSKYHVFAALFAFVNAEVTQGSSCGFGSYTPPVPTTQPNANCLPGESSQPFGCTVHFYVSCSCTPMANDPQSFTDGTCAASSADALMIMNDKWIIGDAQPGISGVSVVGCSPWTGGVLPSQHVPSTDEQTLLCSIWCSQPTCGTAGSICTSQSDCCSKVCDDTNTNTCL